MAGEGSEKKDKKEKKEKKEKKDDSGEDKKEKKEKKDKKDKEEKKDGEKKDKKEKSDKKDPKDKDKEKEKDSRPASSRPGAPPAPQPKPQPKPRPPPRVVKSKDDDYMKGLDLPSSDSESEPEEVEGPGPSVAPAPTRPAGREGSGPHGMSRGGGGGGGMSKEAMRNRRKELEQMAAMEAAKQAALRDDDDMVFDVSYETQGTSEEQTENARDVRVQNLTVRVKGKELLSNTSLTIVHGRHYGLVGPNGKGKSTLMKLVAKRQVPVPGSIDVLLVEQEIVGDDKTALQAVVAADVELMRLRAEEGDLNEQLNDASLSDDQHADIADRLNEIYERMQVIGASTAESRARKILHGLGFSKAMQERATSSFSGGWRMRISLARALYIQPTLLLLDEPTNHLDLRAVLWLEEYLVRYKKTLIVVSHDKEFLNNVTTDIIHLHDEKLHQYKGNFEQFEEMYEQKKREANKEYDKFQKQLKAAKGSGDKAKADKVRAKAKMDQKNKGTMKNDNDGPSDQPKRWNDYVVSFEFPCGPSLSPPLAQLNDVSFQYPGRDDFGLKDLNIGIDMGSRVAIVGPNGAGKTTLMNLLAGDLEPTEGSFRKDMKLRIGRYAQHFVDTLDMTQTPVGYLLSRFPGLGLPAERMRAILGRFGLSGDRHLQSIAKLSGGQKARVVFAAISLIEPHILLLDEPTNHLDMESIDALAEAIEEFEGGVIIISHDARLLERVCEDQTRSEVWIVEDGKVRYYSGDFSDYRSELIAEIQAELDQDEVDLEKERAAAAAAQDEKRRKKKEAEEKRASDKAAGGKK